jgi:predicted enzyme related to lactoylglutathione lyase
MESPFSFTKLIVRDLDAMAAFYRRAYGMHAVRRVTGHIAGEAIEEVMLSPDPAAPFGVLVLLRYADRPAIATGESILGFTTDDLPALLERVRTSGGRVHDAIRDMPEHGVRVAFATDPEGHLAELVQVLA